MRKSTKILLATIGLILTVPLVLAAIIATAFDPNDYKPMLVDLVKDKTQRTLSIPGELKLSFFPRLGVELGPTSLSERNSSETFASIESAQLSVEVMPLFSSRLVVDHILLDGLTARIQRAADGSTNVDDLLGQEEEAPQNKRMAFSIDGIRVTDANLVLDDRQLKRRLEASGLQLETGRLNDGVPSDIVLSTHLKGSNPHIDAEVALQGELQFDREHQQLAAKDMQLRIDGAYADWKDLMLKLNGNADIATTHLILNKIEIEARGKQGARAIQAQLSSPQLTVRDDQVKAGGLRAQAQLTEDERKMTMNVTAPAFEGSAQSFTLPFIVVEATLKQADLDAKATMTGTVTGNLDKQVFASPEMQLSLEGKRGAETIQGKLTTPVSADFQAQYIELAKLAASFTLPNPGGGQLTTTADGKVSADLRREQVALALKGKLDQSQFDIKSALTGFDRPAYQFDIAIDQINVDRYRSAPTASAPATKEQEQAIDLSALKNTKASGSLRIGSLQAADIKASDVRLNMRIADGKAHITPLEARLYGGTLSGAMTATASNPARFSVNHRLNGVNVGPLLKDTLGKNAPIEGKGNVQLNLITQGATASQLIQALDGGGQLELRDGAVHGINIARTVRNARAGLQNLTGKAGTQAGVSNTDERTDFSELKASFNMTNGVLENNDLSAKSPLLRINGAGNVNLAEERLDYSIKATVVSTLKGQGGADLDALKGLTIPVKLTGPFTAIAWNIDMQSLVSQQAQEALKEKTDALRARAKEEVKKQGGQVEDQLKDKVQEQFKNRLKDLLGN